MKKVLFLLPVLAIGLLAPAQKEGHQKKSAGRRAGTSTTATPTPLPATPTPAPTPAPSPTPLPPSPLLNMKLNEWGQLLAWVAALSFFFYKALTGYLITDLSVKIMCERRHKTGDTDFLAVSVTVKKGERGGIQIHDGQVKVRDLPALPPQELVGIRRMNQTKAEPRAQILWTETGYHLNLPPGDEMQFAALFEVPCGQALTVEAAILGRKIWRLQNKVGQWRAVGVSLPHDPSVVPGTGLNAGMGPQTLR